MLRGVLNFSKLSALVLLLGIIFRLFGSSHFRNFLLLLHFALMSCTPSTKASSIVAIKHIAQKSVEKKAEQKADAARIRFEREYAMQNWLLAIIRVCCCSEHKKNKWFSYSF